MRLPEQLHRPALAIAAAASLLGACSVAGERQQPGPPVETLYEQLNDVNVTGEGLKTLPRGFSPLSIVDVSWQKTGLVSKHLVASGIKINDTQILTAGDGFYKEGNTLHENCMNTNVVGRAKTDGTVVGAKATRFAGSNTTSNDIAIITVSGEGFKNIPDARIPKDRITPKPGDPLLLAHYGAAADGTDRHPTLQPSYPNDNTAQNYSEPGLHTLRVLGQDHNKYTIAIVKGTDFSNGAPGLADKEGSGGGAVIYPPTGHVIGFLITSHTFSVEDMKHELNVNPLGLEDTGNYTVLGIQLIDRRTVDELETLKPTKNKC